MKTAQITQKKIRISHLAIGKFQQTDGHKIKIYFEILVMPIKFTSEYFWKIRFP